MQLGAALQAAVRRFMDERVPSPRLNAEMLLMFTLGVERSYLYGHPERELTSDESARYGAALAERARGVPAQYITGHQEFWGLDFIVTPAVLIPRPETEHIVETALDLIRSCHPERSEGSAFREHRHKFRIADVGAGSGCIALALAHELPQAEITALDNSAAALEVARANAARLHLADRVRFLSSDVLAAVANEQFDLVVSNPPYVPEGEAENVESQVRRFEPHDAVFAGDDGLLVYRELVPQAACALAADGWLVLEMGQSVESRVRELLRDWRDVRVVPDLQQIPRVIAARRPA
jgi:release factor glutamine methyltransferase